MWVGSDTKTASWMPAFAQDRRDAAERLERRRGLVLHEDRRRPARRARSRRPGPTAASVVRSPSALPPVTTR